ncbi:hypothetical protein OF83DRAFT_1083070 [Amylostereum chailletii]|nr:hypothetical protein OF83DRAFT_1083070 [Amylostereum chailletii]
MLHQADLTAKSSGSAGHSRKQLLVTDTKAMYSVLVKEQAPFGVGEGELSIARVTSSPSSLSRQLASGTRSRLHFREARAHAFEYPEQPYIVWRSGLGLWPPNGHVTLPSDVLAVLDPDGCLGEEEEPLSPREDGVVNQLGEEMSILRRKASSGIGANSYTPDVQDPPMAEVTDAGAWHLERAPPPRRCLETSSLPIRLWFRTAHLFWCMLRVAIAVLLSGSSTLTNGMVGTVAGSLRYKMTFQGG